MIKKSIVSIIIVLILNIQSGCFSYQEIKLEDEETVKLAGKVKITTLDNKEYFLFDVEIQGSTVKGKEKTHTNQTREIILSAEEIKKIEDEEFQLGLTILVIVAIPVLIFAIGLSQMEK